VSQIEGKDEKVISRRVHKIYKINKIKYKCKYGVDDQGRAGRHKEQVPLCKKKKVLFEASRQQSGLNEKYKI